MIRRKTLSLWPIAVLLFLGCRARVDTSPAAPELGSKPVNLAESPAQPHPPTKLIGTWEGMLNGQEVSLSFIRQNLLRLQIGKKDGAWQQDSEGTWSVDWTTDPATLNIDWGKLGTIQAIIHVTEDTMKIDNLTPGGAAQKTFGDNAANLTRDKVKDAKSQIAMFEYEIGTYWLKHSKIPTSFQTLMDDKLLLAEECMDPWGKTFQYDPAGKRNEGNPYPIYGVPGRIYKIKRPDIWTVLPDQRILGNWPDAEK